MSRITLGNGKVLEGVRWSGDTCLVDYEVSAATFAGGLRGVVIEGTDEEFAEGVDLRGSHERMTAGDVWRWGKYYAFSLVDAMPPSETDQLRADTDFLAMMMGVEL